MGSMSVLARLVLGVVLLGTLCGPRHALASGVTVLTDSRVLQYREALAAAKQVLGDSPVVEVSAPDLAQQLGPSSQAVILAIGQKALVAAQQAGATVVFCMVLGPAAVAAKTVTGLRLEVAPGVQFDYFKQVHQSVRRIGVIYDARTWTSYLTEATQAAASRGLTLVPKAVTDAREVRSAINDIAGNIDALWLMPDPQLVNVDLFNFLLVFTLERKIALFGFFEGFTRAGALASVAPDYAAIGRQAAKLATDLAQKPAESRIPLPPAMASPGVLTINAKTARRLGFDVPEGVQSKANQVYR